jgi:hypothetical protein
MVSAPEADVDAAPTDTNRARRRGSRWRSVLVVVLVILSCISLLVAVVGVWARRNVLDTDRFVDRVDALADDPAIQEALSIRLTDELMTLIDPETFFEEVLPDRGAILAAPLANAVEGFVREQVQAFVASDAFEQVLVGVVERAHSLATRVLKDDVDLPEAPDGTVTLNLLPLIDQILARISEASPEIFGREIDIPEITVDDLPAEAIARLEDTLGRQLDDRFGQIVIYQKGRLESVQEAVRLFQAVVVVSVIATVLFAAAALWLSRRRRRTLIQLMVGAALTLVLLRRLLFRVSEDVEDLARVDVNGAAARAVVEEFVGPLIIATGVLLALFAVAVAAAVLTGDYPWVVSLRERFGLAAGAARDRASDDATVTWVRGHREALQIGAAVVGVLLLWFFDLSWLGVLILLVLVGAFALLVQRIGAVEADDVRIESPPPA